MGPEYVYYAAIACAALLMPFNRMALVVVSAWLVGQYAWIFGVPTSLVDMVANGLAIIAGWQVTIASRERADAMITAMFPLFVALYGAEWAGALHPYYVWWTGFFLGLMQILLLPLSTDWTAAQRKVKHLDDCFMRYLVRHFEKA